MSKKHDQFFLYIDGDAVPVTREVYKTFWYYTNKEDYFMRHLKVTHREWEQDEQKEEYVPAREYSLDRFFVNHNRSWLVWDELESIVLSDVWLDTVLDALTDEEKKIVIEFYINGRTEREMSGILGVPKTSFRRRESRLRKKLGILLKDFL